MLIVPKINLSETADKSQNGNTPSFGPSGDVANYIKACAHARTASLLSPSKEPIVNG